jgi:hypothetical protein
MFGPYFQHVFCCLDRVFGWNSDLGYCFLSFDANWKNTWLFPHHQMNQYLVRISIVIYIELSTIMYLNPCHQFCVIIQEYCFLDSQGSATEAYV